MPQYSSKTVTFGNNKVQLLALHAFLGTGGHMGKKVKRVSQAPPVQRHNELLQVQYECVSTYPTCQLANHQSRSQGTLGRLRDVNVCCMGKDDL